ncbi:oxidoreductase [Pseudoxanthomonas broegbernensis]|uniref:Oxidoreductase n=1 Tax=Pseudoxanthomonas broegbernensis TaxID=83619 RepID=A0A7V8K6E8_9GAMM|nr:oxidoreductase [Pseudoxanthomonas broegbernensis]KAF1685102.1 oxidoreductase [Pseudoxanthomonas broegbernensis]MBB6066235.1 2,3-dihydroxy-p-cumate/2,3-dihydroxybenzoate 3,4-dioxygenase [Pseudoxanthomonas broegbernensis]
MSKLIEQLRYVHLGSRDPEAAARFAEDRLGLRVVSREDGQWLLRGDGRAYCLAFSASRTQAVGLQVRDEQALDLAAERLAAHGIAARRDDALAARRLAKALLAFTLPGGVEVELVARPLDQGWRFFPSREIGQQGLADVALRSTRVAEDEAVLVDALGLRVSDWVGDAAYLALDAAHHRLSLHPSPATGVLAVEFQLDCLDQMMQAWYRLRDAGQAPAHGPGRRPTSGQAFLAFDGPDATYFGFVAEGRVPAEGERPRQFAPDAASYCTWGSECRIAEYGAQAPVRGRPHLREVGA